MREVEVKYRVADLEGLLVALKAAGVVLGRPVRQDDQAYAPAGWSYGDPRSGVTFARLRTVDDERHLFTVKRPADNAMSCVEHETPVDDRQAMHLALLAMGYVPTVRIGKTRLAGALGDLLVCVDDVDGVGWFVELERLVPEGVPAVRVQDEMADWVEGLGVQAGRVTDTYDTLVRAAASA